MSANAEAVIVIYRPMDWFAHRWKLKVWIDGRQRGWLRPWENGEFRVPPGKHTVELSINWIRSRPLEVVAVQHQETTVRTHGQPGSFKKLAFMCFFPSLMFPISRGIKWLFGWDVLPDSVSWWVFLALSLIVTLALFGIYMFASFKLLKDHWVWWTLERDDGSQPPLTTR